MKERPILFKGEMVRAILAGTKTQTRRIINPQPQHSQIHRWRGKLLYEGEERVFCWKQHVGGDSWEDITGQLGHACPQGAVGDSLWVREGIRHIGDGGSEYIADGEYTVADAWPWKNNALPAIHMPRGLCRIRLEITAVRVQRLQDIGAFDARAEGVGQDPESNPRAEYAQLWEKINGPGSWDANPWVWAITFKQAPARGRGGEGL